MNIARLLVACGLLVGLVACQPSTKTTATATPSGAAPSSFVDQAGMMPVMRQELPHEIASSGDYRHEGSGLVLPLTINGLRRVDLAGFDANDIDISANYLRGSERVGLTVYVFPVWLGQRQSRHVSEIPEICADIFGDMKKAAEMRFKDPRLVDEQAQSNPRFPDAAVSRMAVYDTAGDALTSSPPLRTEIHMSCGVRKIWIVQYRISYPEDRNADSIQDDFMSGVPAIPVP